MSEPTLTPDSETERLNARVEHLTKLIDRLTNLTQRALRLADSSSTQGWHPSWHDNLKQLKSDVEAEVAK